MVVLTVIGVLAGILTPVANNARPDQRVMKFKKGNLTIGNVLRELIQNDKYYYQGKLNQRPDGSSSTTVGSDYFCKTMADVVSTKKVNCKTNNTSKNNVTYDSSTAESLTTAKANIDKYCKEVQQNDKSEIEIVTVDGIGWFMANPSATFSEEKENGFYKSYRVICSDVDGGKLSAKDTLPFGYGIRFDGRMISGARADIWAEKCPTQKINYAQLVSEGKLTQAEADVCKQ